MKKSFKSILKTQLLSAVLLIVTVFALQSCGSDMKSKLEKVAKDINTKLPMELGNGIKWTKAEVVSEKTFRYVYTLENISAADIDTTQLKKQQTPAMLEAIKTQPSLKEFRDNDVTMQYDYNDKTGKYAYQIIITPEMYKK